jgi:hypothetical protein
MVYYRAFIIGKDGHFKRAEEFACADDNAALEHARQFANSHDVEVWQEARRIGLVQVSDTAA